MREVSVVLGWVAAMLVSGCALSRSEVAHHLEVTGEQLQKCVEQIDQRFPAINFKAVAFERTERDWVACLQQSPENDKHPCRRSFGPLLKQGRDARALAVAERQCEIDGVLCRDAWVLRTLTRADAATTPPPIPNTAYAERVARATAACGGHDGGACHELARLVRPLQPFLMPRACARGSDEACSTILVDYGRKGEMSLGSLSEDERAEIIPRCPHDNRAHCSQFYQERAAVYEERSLSSSPSSARAFALFRAACEASPTTAVSACAAWATFEPLDPLSAHFLARACRGGDCAGLNRLFYQSATRIDRSRYLGQAESSRCHRAFEEQACLEGNAQTCRSLARRLSFTGYSVGYDPSWARKLERHADKLDSEASR